jgi:hypothetical protein
MLKRLSEAISQSNIESDSLTSEIYCPNHSSCNFSAKQNVEQKLEPSRELSLEDALLEFSCEPALGGAPGTSLARTRSLAQSRERRKQPLKTY